ncbi:MAG: sulfate transporter CysZ [Psychromonas sp.]
MPSSKVVKDSFSGIGYLLQGVRLLSHPKLRAFVLIPLMINILIFAGAFWFLFSSIMQWIESYIAELPAYLSWLSYLFWPFLIVSIIFAFSFIFSTFANLIAAPFNGLLSEKTEQLLSGETLDDSGFSDILKDLPRIFRREFQKLAYFLPRMLLCAVLFFIPFIGQTVAPFIWFIFAGWMMAIQYADYPFDNHKVPFKKMRQTLRQRLGKNLTFGMLVSFFTTIPVVNFIIMPIAVCGATAAWVDSDKSSALTEIQ